MRDSRGHAAQQAALLFLLAGGRCLLALVLAPNHHGIELLALSAGYLALAAATMLVPWPRFPRWASVLLTVPALGLTAAFLGLGLLPVKATAVPFLVMFTWVGAYHARWTSLAVLPGAALAYALPALADGSAVDYRAMALILGGCVIVAEVLAFAMDAAARSRTRAERTAHAFSVVARASSGLHRLDPDQVLAAVADAVMDLGFDGANLAVLDSDAGVFHSHHARGISAGLAGDTFPVDAGTSGQAWRTGEAVVVQDYGRSAVGLDAARLAGVASSVSVPVFCGDAVVAVLHAAGSAPREVPEELVEAIRILASTAGTALENAEEFQAQRSSAQKNAVAALIDPLTGVGNRREAHRMLESLSAGDCLVMIDLDHFKQINDELGHATGDDVLRDLASYLQRSVRDVDRIARLGGEEFLVLLRGVGGERGEATAQRLLTGWQALPPLATFSVGVALHAGGHPDVTLAQADAALYAAKAAGRNTWRSFGKVTVGVPAQRPPAVTSNSH